MHILNLNSPSLSYSSSLFGNVTSILRSRVVYIALSVFYVAAVGYGIYKICRFVIKKKKLEIEEKRIQKTAAYVLQKADHDVLSNILSKTANPKLACVSKAWKQASFEIHHKMFDLFEKEAEGPFGSIIQKAIDDHPLEKGKEPYDIYRNRIKQIYQNVTNNAKKWPGYSKLLVDLNKISSKPLNFYRLKAMVEWTSNQNLIHLFNHCEKEPEIEAFCKQIEALDANTKAAKIRDWMKIHTNVLERIDTLLLAKIHFINNVTLSEIPHEIEYFKNLKKLDLDYQNIQFFPSSLGKLQNLEEFSCRHNSLQVFPKEILQLPKINRIYLSNNSIAEIPTSIDRLSHLKELKLKNNRLHGLQENLGYLKKLEFLELCNNNISELPDNIGQLQNLKELDLGCNQIVNLPQSIGNLKNLEIINIKRNQLQDLPDSFGQLQQLKGVQLNRNQFQTFPLVLGQLPELQQLSLRGNQLQRFPDSPLGQFPKLQVIDLSDNQIQSLPDALIGKMVLLEELDLSTNKLQDLPHRFDQLQNLQRLELQFNQFRVFPTVLENLRQLENLNLSSNKLMALSERIGNMQNLRELLLHNNKLKYFPSSFRQLTNLNYLSIKHNPLKEISILKELPNLDISSSLSTRS